MDGGGIHWHTYVGDIPMETMTLSWAQLEAVGAGRNPFVLLAVK